MAVDYADWLQALADDIETHLGSDVTVPKMSDRQALKASRDEILKMIATMKGEPK